MEHTDSTDDSVYKLQYSVLSYKAKQHVTATVHVLSIQILYIHIHRMSWKEVHKPKVMINTLSATSGLHGGKYED